MLDQCAADAACAAAYPDLEAVLFRVAEQLEKAPIPASRGKPEVTIMTLIDLFDSRNSSGPANATRFIPLILTEWDRGDTTTWDLLSSGATNAPPSTPQRIAQPANLTPDQRTVARLLFEMAATEVKEDQAQFAAVQALAESLKARATGATDLAGRFGDMMQASIVGTRSKDDMLAFLRGGRGARPHPAVEGSAAAFVAAQIPRPTSRRSWPCST